ncbi:MAG: FHA domain-containing protein [Burkholderiaceae bacterium]
MQDREATIAMRLLVTSGQSSLRIVPVLKECLTIGRRPYNDIPLDDLTVSGEHALIRTRNTESMLLDLGSRNGTLVNGEDVKQRVLQGGDVIDIGIYRLRYIVDRAGPAEPAADGVLLPACVDFLNGPRAGSAQKVDRAITRIALQPEQVAVISRRKGGYYLTHLEGLSFPQVNGQLTGLSAHRLDDGDLIELGGVMMRFRLER